MSYGEFLQEYIFDPLQMNDTGVCEELAVLSNRAYAYEIIGDNVLSQGYLYLGFAYAAGNLYSTVEDLMLWNQSLYSNQLVSAFTLEKMITPTLMNPEYGCGLEIHQSDFGKVIGHKGGIGAFSSIINNYIDHDLHLVVLSNVASSSAPKLEQIANEIAALVLGSRNSQNP